MRAEYDMKLRGHRSSGGFTLVELLIGMVIAMLVLAGVVYLFSSSNQTSVAQEKLVTTGQNVRSAMEIMAHEFRMAGYVPMDNLPGGANVIASDVSGQAWSNGQFERLEESTASSMTFIADLNSDNQAEAVRYNLNGTTLTRQSWQWVPGTGWVEQVPGTVNVIEDIVIFNISYIFADGTSGLPDNTDASTSNDRDDVRGLIISLTGETEEQVRGAGGAQKRQSSLRSFIKTRNMGLDVGV